MTALAQRKVKVGDASPRYELSIGGAPFTKRLQTATVTYSADGGTSDMRIVADGGLEARANQRASLRLGYGDAAEEYLAGRITEPADSHWGAGSEANVWGPYMEMAEEILGEQVSYRGRTLEDALYDLSRRAGFGAGSVEVRAGRSFVIGGDPALGETDDTTAGVFALETRLSDVAGALMGSANFVGCDRPGGRRLYMPKPRPGATGRYKARYDEGHYPPGGGGSAGFAAPPNRRGFYARVVVFRRREDGSMAFPLVEVPVTAGGRRARGRRPYVISDFLGGHAEALREGAELARLLSGGTHACALSGISPNPDLHLYDVVNAETTELRDEGGKTRERYLAEYAFPIDGRIGVEIARAGMPMAVSGEGVRVREKKLPKPFYVSRGAPSPYVVRRTAPPFGTTAGELAGVTAGELATTTAGELNG